MTIGGVLVLCSSLASPASSCRHGYRSSPLCQRRRRRAAPLLPSASASAAAAAPPELEPSSAASATSGSGMEAQEEAALAAGGSDIYGIPRAEWLRLQTPARYLGNEFGAVHKPWEQAEIRFVLSYPEIYEVGASNTGHIILYSILNQQPGLLCDRSYYPGPDMAALLARYGRRLFGVESRRPLSDFDILGFSLSYELGGTNILEMLRLSGIPLTWRERQEAAGTPWDPAAGSPPLIFGGGPTATSNPEPFSNLFDFFALGDGEEVLVEIGQCLQRCRGEALDRDATLLRLATTVEGVYVPQFYEAPNGWGGAVFPVREGVPARVKRRVCAPDPFQQLGLVPYVSTVHDRLTVEIRRGCTRGCRFCQPGMLTRPARDVAPEKVVDAVEHGMRLTGYNEFSLLSLSCSDYLALPSVGIQIKNRLKDDNVALSLPSQRVDRFDDDIAAIVTNSAKRSGLTFAPEAGSQRLRDIINKGLTNEELLRGVRTAWDKGWRQIKLYFMIGLPGETDEDVMGIADTVEWLQRECRQGRFHLAVNVTISNFTPKPHTPFQWHSVSTAEFKRKQAMLRVAMDKLFQVKANFTPVGISAMEDFIGRGDRRIGSVIRRAWELGATNDAWWQSEQECFKAWEQAINDTGLDWKYRQVEDGEWDVLQNMGDERYRGQGAGGKGRVDRGVLADSRLDAPLPWDHIDTGIAKWWLKNDLQRALEAATVPDCSHSGVCTECGVCDDGDNFGENVVHPPPPIPEFEGHYRPNSTRAQRLRFRFAKRGDLVFIGHLDLMRTLDRACRRAALPISADESPYAVRQRIVSALPLPLGATSTGEWLELTLTQRLDPADVRRRLQEQLPGGLELLGDPEDALVKKADGSNGESMGQQLQSVEYFLVVETAVPQGEQQGSWGGGGVSGLVGAVAATLADPRFSVVRKEGGGGGGGGGGRKRGKGKGKGRGRNGGGGEQKKSGGSVEEDLKWALLDLEVCSADEAARAGVTLEVMAPSLTQQQQKQQHGGGEEEAGGKRSVLRFRTACAQGNPVMSPAMILARLNALAAAEMAGAVSEAVEAAPLPEDGSDADGAGSPADAEVAAASSGRYWLAHMHRSEIALRPMAVPQPDWQKLRSLCRQEGHLGAALQFGRGAWACGGIQHRPHMD